MSDTSDSKNIRGQLRTLEQIRDDLLHKRHQLVCNMIAASSTERGGSSRPHGVQIDSPHKGAAWFTWGQGIVVDDAEYVLPRLLWLFDELGMHGVPNLPHLTVEPKTEHEALGYLNTLLACCDGAMDTPDKKPANDVLADRFDKLTPKQRELLLYLDSRENKQASIRDAMKYMKKIPASNKDRRSFLTLVRRLDERLTDHYPHLEIVSDRIGQIETLRLKERPQTATK